MTLGYICIPFAVLSIDNRDSDRHFIKRDINFAHYVMNVFLWDMYNKAKYNEKILATATRKCAKVAVMAGEKWLLLLMLLIMGFCFISISNIEAVLVIIKKLLQDRNNFNRDDETFDLNKNCKSYFVFYKKYRFCREHDLSFVFYQFWFVT